MPVVDVPGVGSVDFPDSMKVEQIQAEAGRLAQMHAGQTAAGPNPISPLAIAGLGAGAGALAVGGGLAAKAGLSKLPPAVQALARLAGKQIPGAHQVSDIKRFAQDVMGGPPPELMSAAPAASTATRSTRVEITPELRRRFPALKHFKTGETISAAQLDKIKLAKAGVPTRPINVQGKPQAKAPAQTETYTGGRGASGPELERRAAAMAQASGKPSLSLVPQEMPQLPPAASLEEQLQRAVAAEQAMGARGIPPGAGRTALRAGLRSALPPALEGLMFLLNAGAVPQQLQESRHDLDERMRQRLGMTPEQFYGPQGI